MDLYLSLATRRHAFQHHARRPSPIRRRFIRRFPSSGITTWVSTPSFAQMCLVERSFGEAMLPDLRRFLFCGETLANETAAQLLDRFPSAEVWNTYGPTEATVATTSIRVDREVLAQHAPLPVGYVMPGTRIPIRGENGEEVAEGERGEIVIIGPNVSPGYLGRADLTEKAFFATEGTRAYRTGDWGRMREGLIFFEGRMDGQIKLHGYRIELGDIESHVCALCRRSPTRSCWWWRKAESRIRSPPSSSSASAARVRISTSRSNSKSNSPIACPTTWCRENSVSWRRSP